MTHPVYKIEIYDSTPTLIHTITKDAIKIHVKETVTSNIGIFSFALPTVKGVPNPYYYTDVAVNDTVKIWLGYDSIGGGDDPVTVGKIQQITTPLTSKTGYIRVFSGINQGEILKRRLKRKKKWVATDASAIVMELADDLGLVEKIGTADSGSTTTTVDAERTEANDYWNGQYIQYITGPNRGLNRLVTDFVTGTVTHNAFPSAVAAGHEYLILPTVNIEENTIDVDLTIESETHFDVLTKVSDFWADITHQVKNDFYVDVDGDLVWKARPIRTVGVESLTVGNNILGYNVLRDVNSVRNKILVFGRCNQPYPASGDAAESLTNWATDETGPTQATDWVEEGTYSIKATTAGDQSIYLGYTIDPAISCQFKHDYKKLHIWVRVNAGTFDSDAYLHLQLKTAAADYYKKIIRGIEPRKLTEYELPIGPMSGWYEYGSPSWENINELRVWFSNSPTSSNLYLWVDGVRLLKDYNATIEGATSQTNYGVRELEHYSDQLWSNDDCTKRGQALLYQLEDPIVRLDVATLGNTNIRIGDRLSMTIPAEGISGANYDVVSVDHFFDADAGFITQCSMINTENTRTVPATSIKEITMQKFGVLRKIGQGAENIQ